MSRKDAAADVSSSMPDTEPRDDDDDDDDDGLLPPSELTLLTLNCWGLEHISSVRRQRLGEVGRRLARMRPRPQIVCLQECWVESDFQAIREATRHLLPHAKMYRAGVFGAGLVILSRWPFQDSSMLIFPLNGRPTAFWRGDWYVGKGVACAVLRVGPAEGDVIHVFNTHTHAPYQKHHRDDSYACHRVAQAWEISKLLRTATATGRLVVALGDFNMLPLSLPHRIITSRAPVRDLWRVLHPHSSLGPARHPAEAARNRPVPGARFNLEENGATSDGLYNTWRWTKNAQNRLRAGRTPCPVDPDAPDERGKRLDYIFASIGLTSPESASSSRRRWVVKSAAVTLTDPHPDLGVSLSDHFAVSATIRQHSAADGDDDDDDDDEKSRLENNTTTTTLPLSAYDEILSLVDAYTARERSQRRYRALHFYAALVVWAACLVAVWFAPGNFVCFLLALVGSLVLAAGLIDGLLALLFFSSELRSLDEFAWEVRNARWAAAACPVKQK
ncbi:hypothetical protein XA68_16330 [Ophiocordyceps unilateralis]|uniref:Endonuclease/exonuclease/phosphatase domain-containing protein n=1 Tax=Ophiocordyceps unilateralis TaxID=268505 RepID=A0A2A9P6J3_OPHUN|nr:hypothetical protein XA68_16330 [Ophiocordyceps unilateralis]